MQEKTNLSKTYSLLKWLTLVLVVLQLLVKIYVEFHKAGEVRSVYPILETSYALAAAWVILIPLMIQDMKLAFFAAAIFGIINGILAPLTPLSGICHHYFAGIFVGVHGVLIAVIGMAAFLKHRITCSQ